VAAVGAVAGLVASAPTSTAAPCGVNLGDPAIARAVSTLRPAFSDMDVPWDPLPYAGNFDPCLPLSTALVSVRGATGSSPDQALFFNYGRYLGTATWKPYGYTNFNARATRPDTVVLDYKDGRFVCTACPGPVNSVRYRWRDGRVVMLDPPPP
jgi:hypothetical protein